jgi:hypothetical protein
MVLPTGIATDDSNKVFFGEVVARGELAALYDFENREGLFPAVVSLMKFSVFVLRGQGKGEPARLLSSLTRPEHAEDPGRLHPHPEDFALLNPNTKHLPRLPHPAGCRAHPGHLPPGARAVAGGAGRKPLGGAVPTGLFNMSNDSHLFRTREDLEGQGFRLVGNRFVRGEEVYLPLYEAKMFWHYDHRFATFAGKDTRDVEPGEKEDPAFLPLPRYWVPKEETEARLREAGWERGWLLGFRNVTNATTSARSSFPASLWPGWDTPLPCFFPFWASPASCWRPTSLPWSWTTWPARRWEEPTSPSTTSNSSPSSPPTDTPRKTSASSSPGSWSSPTPPGTWPPWPRTCGKRRTRG